MKLIILGAGTAIPASCYSPSGIYVRVGSEHVLLDAGAGTLQRLAKIGITFLQLDRIFFTHFHPDHCLDLVSILFAMRLPHPARTKPLIIYGPVGLKRLYRQLNTAFKGWIEPKTYRLTLREIGETALRLKGYTVRTKSMTHSAQTLGYRIEATGKSFAYSGDTDVCREVIELGRLADLLVLECSMPDARKAKGHLTPTECGRIAGQAGCRRLILTHFYPVFKKYNVLARVRRHFRGKVSLARDLHSFHI